MSAYEVVQMAITGELCNPGFRLLHTMVYYISVHNTLSVFMQNMLIVAILDCFLWVFVRILWDMAPIIIMLLLLYPPNQTKYAILEKYLMRFFNTFVWLWQFVTSFQILNVLVYSGTCIGDHLLRATTCLRDHFRGPPVVFYYILHLLRATTCLTRPRPPILRVRRPFFPVKATTFPRKKTTNITNNLCHHHRRPQKACRPWTLATTNGIATIY